MIAGHRIAGIIFLLGGGLFYLLMRSLNAGVITLLLCGIILLSLRKYGKKTLHTFIKSLKFNQRFFLVVIYDFMFWLVFFIITLLYGSFVQRTLDTLGIVDLQTQSLLQPEILQQNIGLLQSFFASLAVGFVIALVCTIIIYALFTALSWSVVAQKRLSLQMFKKFLALSALWLLSWVLLSFLLLIGLKAEVMVVVAFVLLVLLLHLTTVINWYMVNTLSVGKSLKKMFGKGFQLHKFVVPYIYAYGVYMIFLLIMSMLSQFQTLIIAISGIVSLLYLAWLKIYIPLIEKTIK